MNKVKYSVSTLEIIFLFVLMIVMTVSRGSLIFNILAILSVVPIFLLKNSNTYFSLDIQKGKKLLYAFILIFSTYMIILLLYKYFIWNHRSIQDFTINQHRLLQLPINLTIFLGLIFNIRIKDFKWTITLKSIIMVLIVFSLTELSMFIILEGYSEFAEKINVMFLINFIQKLYYPSIVEELIFRGFLLTGLIYVGMKSDKANILQAILFGMIHISNYNSYSFVNILACSVQICMGYILGKIYLETKSLTPCIFLHALLDTL